MKKKLLLGAVSAAAVAAPIAAVVSCSVNNYGEGFAYYGSIQTITDAGSVADKSFNESAFWAARDFVQDTAEGKGETFGYSQPKSTTKVLMQKAYLSAMKKGAKTLLLPGFTHSDTSGGDAVTFAFDHHAQYPNVKYISPDGGYFGSRDAVKEGNFYNLSYASQESGYLAAIYAGVFMNMKHKVQGNTLKVATFGGTPIAYGVTSYMDGFLQGAKWFNTYIADTTHADINPGEFKPEQLVFQKGSKATGSDFTGSFDAGAATSKVSTLIEDGAQIILPVAGPQTGDVTGLISKLNKQGSVYAMGVDVDQAPIYGQDLIIGSAVKGIYASVMIAQKELTTTPPAGRVPADSPLDPTTKGFKQFNKAAEDSSYAKQIFTELKDANKISHKYSESQINALTQFTGFVPSDAEFAKTVDATAIYKAALAYVKNATNSDDKLMAGLEDTKNWNDPYQGSLPAQQAPTSANVNALAAFTEWGGFMQIAHGKVN